MKPIEIELWTTRQATVKLRVTRFAEVPNGIKATVCLVADYQGYKPEAEIFRDEVSLWKLKARKRFARECWDFCDKEDLLYEGPPLRPIEQLVLDGQEAPREAWQADIEERLIEFEDILLQQQEVPEANEGQLP